MHSKNWKKMVGTIAGILSFLAVAGAEWTPPAESLLPGSDLFPDGVAKARWLWDAGPMRSQGTAYYRYTLNIDEPVKSAWFLCIMDDNGGNVRLNNQIEPEVAFKQPDAQVKFHLFEPKNWRIGRNVFAFNIANGGDLGGIILRGEVTLVSGKVIELSSGDKGWKASAEAVDHWETFEFDDSAWQPARAFGDPRTFPWSALSNVMDFMLTDAEKKAMARREKEASNIEFLKNQPDQVAKIRWQNNVAGFEVNGEIVPPMVYLVGETPWITEVADMLMKLRGSGIRVLEYQIQATRAYRSEGHYDFSFMEADLNRIIALNPEAFLMVAVRLDMGKDWLAAHPDEKIGYAAGEADGYGGPMGRFQAPSMASQKFREEIQACARDFCSQLKKMDAYKRVIAMRVSHGIYSEWHYYGMVQDMPDTGRCMTNRFRAFLRGRYGNDPALQKAWHTPHVTFDTATVPDAKERIGQNRFLRNYASGDRKVIDYYECQQEVIAETLLYFAECVKENAPKLLVGAYYGYTFCMGYPPEGQTQLMERVLSSPYIDFLSSPYSYWAEARYAGGDGMPRMMPDLFRRYGKLPILEDDTRNWLSTESFMKITDKAESLAVLRRNIANAWLAGGAIQFLDFDARRSNHCTFNHPEIFTIFHQSAAAWHKIFQEGNNNGSNDIALVLSPLELIRHGYPDTNLQRPPERSLVDDPVHALKRAGLTFDLLELNSFLASEKQYKVVVFMNLFSPTAAERTKILAKVRQKGVTALWVYAPGFAAPEGFSDAIMSELSGIRLKAKFDRAPMAVRFADNTVMDGKWSESPRVESLDKKAKTLAVWSDNAAPAVVSKMDVSGNLNIFAGMPVIQADAWRKVLADSKVHAWTPANTLILSGNDQLLLAHTGKAGTFKLTLPRVPREVRELLNGRILPFRNTELDLNSEGPETWLLQFIY